MIHALLLAAIAAASPNPVQVLPPAATAALPVPGAVLVTLTTTAGPIVLALDKAHAPVTTANFLRYVDAKRLDGIGFYRAMKMGDGSGLIQGGLRNDPRKLFPPVAHEPTSATGLSHTDGTISMATARPGAATADFFICVGDMSGLDAHGTDQGFAAFGKVVGGMDVVRRILTMPTTADAETPAMRGQMLAAPVRVLTARRGDPGPR